MILVQNESEKKNEWFKKLFKVLENCLSLPKSKRGTTMEIKMSALYSSTVENNKTKHVLLETQRVKSEEEQCFRSVRVWLWTKQNKERCSPPSSTRINLSATVVSAESSGWRTDEPLCALGKQPLRYISGRFFFYWTQILASSHTLKSTKLLTQSICSLWLAVIFNQDVCPNAWIP